MPGSRALRSRSPRRPLARSDRACQHPRALLLSFIRRSLEPSCLLCTRKRLNRTKQKEIDAILKKSPKAPPILDARMTCGPDLNPTRSKEHHVGNPQPEAETPGLLTCKPTEGPESSGEWQITKGKAKPGCGGAREGIESCSVAQAGVQLHNYVFK
ncbi:hypothetical protein AAY473_026518 [Plecturocebus cupreus]